MNILAFCFFPAFVPPKNGGQSRLFNFYRTLSKFHEVTLLTSTHVGAPEETIAHGGNFTERRIPKNDYFVKEYLSLEKYSSGGDLSGPAIAASSIYPTDLHRAYLEEYEKADAIIHDFPFTARYDIFLGMDAKPRIYSAHNCEIQLYRQLHPEDKSSPIVNVVRETESYLLKNADLVLYCSETDLFEFRQLAPQAHFKALHVPNGTSLRMNPEAAARILGHPTAVFIGSGHPPNVEAAEFIVKHLAPKMPHVNFEIIGSCLPEARYPANVHRLGVLTDDALDEVLSRASVALNPMSTGSGSNVKVLDYFSRNLPVVSTAFGMRGLNVKAGIHYLEAGLEEFAQVLESALSQPKTLDQLIKAGRELLTDKYTWDAIVEPILQSLGEAVERKVSQFVSYVLALNDYDSYAGTGGGCTRTQGLHQAIHKWCPVVFLSFSDDDHIRVRRCEGDTMVINVPKTEAHIQELLKINPQFHVSVSDIIAGRHCAQNPWMNAIYRILRKRARCIVIEHCYMVPLPAVWNDKFVYSSHNHEAGLKRMLLEGHPAKNELLRDVAKLERFAVECSAASIAVSTLDAESLVKNMRTAGPVVVVPNGAAVPQDGHAVEEAKKHLCDQMGQRAVVFLGSAHMPNIEAARFITERLAPRCGDVTFHILGSVGDAIARVPRNVKLWGVVNEDVKSAVLQNSSLAINPMLSGSGSNVKLADYIANGLFVVSTEFGVRGYSKNVREHVAVAAIEHFADAIQNSLNRSDVNSNELRQLRRELFQRELCMQGLAKRFVETLQRLGVRRKRVLYVAYRYVAPALGGAEVNIEKFVRALGNSNIFDVDVVAPEVSAIHSYWRFGERYTFDAELGAPVDIPNVRFARFPSDAPADEMLIKHLRRVWQIQPRFERAVSDELISQYAKSGLAWGWGYPEKSQGGALRWAFAECGVYLIEPGHISVNAYAPDEVVIDARHGKILVGGPWHVKGKFQLNLHSPAGELVFTTSALVQVGDPRPVGFQVTHLVVGASTVDLALPMLHELYLTRVSADSAFGILEKAAQATRGYKNLRLTDGRGPWSNAMERFISDHLAEYDLVVTHNNIFRPAVVAVAEAKKQGVPSILIPHAHLDDDYYHFPDVMQSARDASLVLAAPQATCKFLSKNGCNVRYLPAGCDAAEEFTVQDIDAFRKIHHDNRQFILVLGRKSGAKNYNKIIQAVEALNRKGYDLHVVLIGPDDDGVPVNSRHATYLGRQPRQVVRGALQSCLALCNMSASESFGIVLLEAWLAGKPVLVNRHCVAFHDMAVDGENALFVDDETLAEGIVRIIDEAELAVQLAMRGKEIVNQFDWGGVCAKFVSACCEIAGINEPSNKNIS